MKNDFLHRSWLHLDLVGLVHRTFLPSAIMRFKQELTAAMLAASPSLPAVTMCSMQLVAHPRFHPAGKKSQPRCWLHRLFLFSLVVAMRCRQLAAHPYLHQAGNRSLDAGCIIFPHHCGNAFQAARRTLQSPSSRQEVPAAMSLHQHLPPRTTGMHEHRVSDR